MKQKGNRSPRPRFHVAFPVEPITDPNQFTALMHWVHRKNFGRVKRGEEAPMRELLKTAVFKIRK